LPENHHEVRVLAWQLNKPRVMQMLALDVQGRRVPGVTVRLVSDEHGSFEAGEVCRELELHTARDGVLAFRWVGWPTEEPHPDITCWLTAAWENEDVGVYFEEFPED